MCPLEGAESSEGGRPALAGLSALALRMYFGVSDQLHLLSQKQVWSEPRVLPPQAKVSSLCIAPAHPGQAGALALRGRQSARGGADSSNVAPMPGEVQILWDRGMGWLRTR